MVMGRPNKGVAHVDGCEGSARSKKRLQAVLRTISGELSVQEALSDLGIQRVQFADLRLRCLQGAVDALEPRPPGRPRKHDAETAQTIAALRERVASLERQLAKERARADIAEILPGRTDGQKGGEIESGRNRRRRRSPKTER